MRLKKFSVAIILLVLLINLLPVKAEKYRENHVKSKIYFERDRDIWTINPDGSEETKITNVGKFTCPVLSPDGKKIVYVSNAKLGGEYGTDYFGFLGIATSDGSESKCISAYRYGTQYESLYSIQWFLDSKTFRHSTNIFDLKGNIIKQIPITDKTKESFVNAVHSPDGSKIVYLTIEDKKNNREKAYCVTIWISDVNKDTSEYLISYTAYGAAIMEGNISDSIAWSPDGKKIAICEYGFGYDTNKLWYINLTEKKRNLIIDEISEDLFIFNPVWTIDSKEIIYHITDRNSSKVFLINAENSKKKYLTSNGRFRLWSPDGKKMLLTEYDPNTNKNNISVYDLEKNNLSNLTKNAFPLGWIKSNKDNQFNNQETSNIPSSKSSKPDNENYRIVYVHIHSPEKDNAKYDLFLIDTNSLKPIQLTYDGVNVCPSISSDGTKVAFVKKKLEDKEKLGRYPRFYGDIYVMDYNGENLKKLTTNGKSSNPVLSKDGKTIFFSSEDRTIYTISIDGNNKKKIYESPKRKMKTNGNFSLYNKITKIQISSDSKIFFLEEPVVLGAGYSGALKTIDVTGENCKDNGLICKDFALAQEKIVFTYPFIEYAYRLITSTIPDISTIKINSDVSNPLVAYNINTSPDGNKIVYDDASGFGGAEHISSDIWLSDYTLKSKVRLTNNKNNKIFDYYFSGDWDPYISGKL